MEILIKMKPYSPHWADIAAVRIIKARGEDKENYVVASGITPSGKVHIGNFREVITVDLVARALKSAGRKVRFIYSWDNFDTFRKVPKNVPNPDSFTEYLRKPIARIPDPWGDADSYSQGRIDLFEAEVAKVGINPEFIYQEKEYSSGVYADGIRKALENIETLKKILNEHRSTPLADDWLPTSIYCESCQKDVMNYQKYDGEWNYSYHCASCGHEATVDIRETKNLKLSWRTDWPMRWAHEKVDFEPGGKDHSSQGGSYDTGKSIVREVYGQEAPEYLQYDFVMIKGGTGKMSSSSGELITLGEILEVYDPQIVRWIFANQRPNHDFSIAFDEDVIKTYEEFDKAETIALGPEPKKLGKYPLIKRVYELSTVSASLPSNQPYRAPFRALCNSLQICDKDIERTYERYYQEFITTEEDKAYFKQRAERAITWLEKYAPEEFVYAINKNPVAVDLNEKQEAALGALKMMLKEVDLTNLEAKEINELLYQKVVHQVEAEPKEVFQAVYQKLISREKGPRLPGFLKELGNDRVLGLI